MGITVRKGVRTDHLCCKCGNGITQQLDSDKSNVSVIMCPKCMRVVYACKK